MSQFEEFAKIFRWTRDLIITEKIDGTNAQVLIERVMTEAEGGTRAGAEPVGDELAVVPIKDVVYSICAGSRNRWLTRKADNFGFAAWVEANAATLVEGLGEGRHFGEWWGCGIQRGYLLKEKRWSLFNVGRWRMPAEEPWNEKQRVVPECCHVVPTLFRGMNAPGVVEEQLRLLDASGSKASPGFFHPEGIVIFHVPSGHLFKKTILKDEEPKGRH